MNIQPRRWALAPLWHVIEVALRALGYFNSVLVLTLLFFLFLVPLGVLFRLSGRSIFRKASRVGWVERNYDMRLDKPF